MSTQALERIAAKLRQAGADLPAPQTMDAIADAITGAQAPGIDELEHESRLLRARNERLERELRALEQPEQPAEPVAWPEGYEPHELPTDYTGKLWIEGQVRALYERTQPAPQQRQPQEFVCSTGLCHYRRPLTDVELDNIAAAQDRGSRHWRKR